MFSPFCTALPCEPSCVDLKLLWIHGGITKTLDGFCRSVEHSLVYALVCCHSWTEYDKYISHLTCNLIGPPAIVARCTSQCIRLYLTPSVCRGVTWRKTTLKLGLHFHLDPHSHLSLHVSFTLISTHTFLFMSPSHNYLSMLLSVVFSYSADEGLCGRNVLNKTTVATLPRSKAGARSHWY